MAQQTINVGAAPNDGTGTPLRTAFQYTNSNFTELYTATGPSGNNINVPGAATITGDLTVDTNTLFVDSANNRVGVGTATPVATLQSNGTLTISGGTAASTANGLHLYFNTGTNTATISAFHSGVDNRDLAIDGKTIGFSLSGSTAMTLNSTGLGVGASPNISASGKALTISGAFTRSRLELQNTDGGTGGVTCGTISWFNGSNLIADITGAANSGSATLGSLAFSTGGSTRLTIDSSGNVGIGVTPSAIANVIRLEIGGALSTNLTLRSTSANASARNWMVGSNVNAFGDFVIRQGNSQGAEPNSGTDRLVIDLNGNPIFTPSSTPATLTTNGQLTVNATSNTNLRFSYRGSDGVTRVADITLA